MPTSFTKETKVLTSFTKETKPTTVAFVYYTWDSQSDTWDSATYTWDTSGTAAGSVFTKETKPTTSFNKEQKP